MAMFVFAALIAFAIAIAWGTVAVALRQSPPEQVTMEETAAVPGWSITPAQLPGAGISVPAVLLDTRSRNMRSHLYGAIAIAVMIATPAMAQTTTPTSNTMSTQGPGAGTSTLPASRPV
jgi:hypothetical protein